MKWATGYLVAHFISDMCVLQILLIVLIGISMERNGWLVQMTVGGKVCMLCLALIMTMGMAAQAQPTVSITFSVSSDDPDDGISVRRVGVDSRATICIDPELDEDEIPPIPPPFALFVFLFTNCIDEVLEERVLADADIRPTLEERFFEEMYELRFTGGTSDSITITWSNDLHPSIDSAKMSIPFVVDDLDLRSQSEITLARRTAQLAEITVWYDRAATAVEETIHDVYIDESPLPNPTDGALRVPTERWIGGECTVYTSIGANVVHRRINDNITALDLSALSGGVYILQLIHPDGRKKSYKIVRY